MPLSMPMMSRDVASTEAFARAPWHVGNDVQKDNRKRRQINKRKLGALALSTAALRRPAVVSTPLKLRS